MLLKLSRLALQFSAACLIGMVLSPTMSFAQDAAPIEGVLDWAVQVLQGNIARSLAIIAVCFLGFMAMTGRLSWQFAGSIIIGIALVFGAVKLVDALKQTVSS